MVEGVHFLEGEGRCHRRQAAAAHQPLRPGRQAAEPFGYTLMTAWPPTRAWSDQEAFIRGLAEDGDEWGVTLLGGDTVSTPGPLTVSATVFGWVPSGKAVRRSGAKPGDLLVVLGAIGDGFLGLKAARGEIDDPHGDLARAYRLPTPALHLRAAVRAHASAAADVSDGLIADALHIAEASGCGVTIDLERMPVSPAAAAWLSRQPDKAATYLALATGGDDYALACASANGPALLKACDRRGPCRHRRPIRRGGGRHGALSRRNLADRAAGLAPPLSRR